MIKLQKSVIITLIVSIMAAPIAMANPMGGDRGPGPGGPEMMDKGRALISQLNLTTEQIETLKKQKLKNRRTMVQLRADLELLQIDLAEAAHQDNPDRGKIEKMAKKVGAIHGEMIAERMNSIVFLRSILTNEQKQMMDAQQLHFEGKRGPKGKKGHGKRR